MAFSGGFRYKPTTSSNFSTNCLSLESLRARGFKPEANSPYRDSLTRLPWPSRTGLRAWRRPFLHDPGPLPAADRGNPSTAGSVLFDSPEAIFNETIAPTSGDE